MFAMRFSRSAFQPTLPARGATPRRGRTRRRNGISTHAPRTGSDFTTRCTPRAQTHFNPRSPHGERQRARSLLVKPRNFNPRSPHGERHVRRHQSLPRQGISTHAPRTGSDVQAYRDAPEYIQFQPTLPARGATSSASYRLTVHVISTHAPRTGSDAEGERLSFAEQQISTHAPRTGSDVHDSCGRCSSRHFNPRSPHGERQFGRKPDCRFRHISTHAPRTGSDKIRAWNARHEQKFQPTLPARGATGRSGRSRRRCFYFNPRSPHGERPAGSRKRSSR